MRCPMCGHLPGRKVTALLNPCTATMVQLTPPYQISPDASPEAAQRDLDNLIRRFEAYCLAAWQLGRIDPTEVATVAGWVNKPLPPVADTGWLKTERDERQRRQPKPPADTSWIKMTAEYPRPWWRRLLGLPAKRVHIGTSKVEPWPWVGQTPPGGTANTPRSGE